MKNSKQILSSVFISILSIFFVSMSFADDGVLEKEIKSMINEMSALPDGEYEKNLFYGGLKDLHKQIAWHHPDSKDYTYKNINLEVYPIDQVTKVKALISAYELLLLEGNKQGNNPDNDKYTSSYTYNQPNYGFQTASTSVPYRTASWYVEDKVLYPREVLDVDEFSKDLYSESLSLGLGFRDLIKLNNTTVYDNRYVTTFFFSHFVDKNHIPLESFKELNKYSQKGEGLVSSLESYYAEKINNAYLITAENYEKAHAETKSSGDISRATLGAIDSAMIDLAKLRYSMGIMVNKLHSATQLANDIVNERSRKIDTINDLEETMVRIGEGLAQTLEDINSILKSPPRPLNYREYEALSHKQRRDGYSFFNPSRELILMLDLMPPRVSAVSDFGQPQPFRRLFTNDANNTSIEIYKEAVKMVYMFAASGAMAKLLDLDEVRGSGASKTVQELKYRGAQLMRLSGFNRPKETASTSLTTNVKIKRELGKPKYMNRRDYINDDKINNVAKLQDQMWKAFFRGLGEEKTATEFKDVTGKHVVGLLTSTVGSVGASACSNALD